MAYHNIDSILNEIKLWWRTQDSKKYGHISNDSCKATLTIKKAHTVFDELSENRKTNSKEQNEKLVWRLKLLINKIIEELPDKYVAYMFSYYINHIFARHLCDDEKNEDDEDEDEQADPFKAVTFYRMKQAITKELLEYDIDLDSDYIVNGEIGRLLHLNSRDQVVKEGYFRLALTDSSPWYLIEENLEIMEEEAPTDITPSILLF